MITAKEAKEITLRKILSKYPKPDLSDIYIKIEKSAQNGKTWICTSRYLSPRDIYKLKQLGYSIKGGITTDYNCLEISW